MAQCLILGSRHDLSVPDAPSASAIAALTDAASNGVLSGETADFPASAARCKAARKCACRFVLAHHFCQELQSRHQPIPGGGMVAHHDMARLLATQIIAARTHRLDHVAIAHCGAMQANPRPAKKRSRPKFDMTVLTKAPPSGALIGPTCRQKRHDLIAIGHLPCLVNDHDAIGITIKAQGHISARFLEACNRACGWVEPTPSLMLNPLGDTPMATTSAPIPTALRGGTMPRHWRTDDHLSTLKA